MRRLSRRDFLKNISLGTAGLTLAAGPAAAEEFHSRTAGEKLPAKIRKLKETYSVCCFCGCGCGLLLYSNEEGRLVFCEGYADSPINAGTICPKGNGIIEGNTVINKKRNREANRQRVTKPLYRAPNSDKWEEKSWEWTLSEIAKRIKKTRDESFVEKDEQGVTVNRTTAIAHTGAAALDNEEIYLLHKMYRALGVINIEHCARL
ncbi:molybdopterin oxidoreductase Fe4S4 region [Desulforamulus ruminis DSM 2154]|uniref:Molybdopterin oxidoreductase Fe4S4 region n=3 Tax=Desulforamulus ruminis TaxID=1564 RepID=F6DQY8_DESRL|nr:molybdopterin oxidoreductase Fe4S4 region [Desulforamulus ruminis DSM 2154]